MELQPDPQTLDAALAWHVAVAESVAAHRAAVFEALRSGALRTTDRFFLQTYEDVDTFFAAESAEVEGYAVVNILAAAEAAVRQDYRDRVDGRFRDALSRAYVRFHKSLDGLTIHRPPFDHNGILDVLRTSGVVAAHLVAAFRDVLKLRHWFAHGRYWPLGLAGSAYAPADVHAVCRRLVEALPP